MKTVLAKLNRRSFFGVAAASPLAMSGVAKEVEKMGLGTGGGGGANWDRPTGFNKASASVSGDWLAQRLAETRQQLEGCKRPKPNPYDVQKLDSDLVASKSFSLGCRLRIQAERDADRLHALNVGFYEREIASLLSKK